MKVLLQGALVRVVWDDVGFTLKLFPYIRPDRPSDVSVIVIDLLVSNGSAVLFDSRIAVEVERYLAGDTIDELAADYGRQRVEIEEAIRYEIPIAA